MKLGEIYNLAIKKAIQADPRGVSGVREFLAEKKKKYQKLDLKEKKEFDLELLKNPYSDSRILYGNPQIEVRRVLAGIDMEPDEVLLADRLTERGQKIDLIIAHHPEGKALATLEAVMHLQEDLLYKYGVPINIAESLMSKRIAEVSRTIAPINHNRSVDMAKILKFPFICLHTTSDNLVYDFIEKLMKKKRPKTVGEIIEVIKEIPEYKEAIRYSAGPRIFSGKASRRAGKIAVLEMTGGTEGAKEIYERLSQAGVGTIISMHQSEENREEAAKHHINVVIAGHMASDSLGMNLFLDELEKRGIEIIPASGLIRVSRINKGR